MSVECIPPYNPLLYSKTGKCSSIPIFSYLHPLIPHFYIAKLGNAVLVYLFFFLFNIPPLYPAFIAKLGNAVVYLVFLIFAQNIECGYSLEPPQRGGSNEYPQSMLWIKNKKIRYTPVNPSFTIQKGVFMPGTSFPDVMPIPILTYMAFSWFCLGRFTTKKSNTSPRF